MHTFWKAVTLKFRPDEIPVGVHVTEATAPLHFLGTSDPLLSESSTEHLEPTVCWDHCHFSYCNLPLCWGGVSSSGAGDGCEFSGCARRGWLVQLVMIIKS